MDALHGSLTPPRRSSLLASAWRWREVLAPLVCLGILVTAMARVAGAPWACVGVSVMAGALSPPWSKSVTACWWRLITPPRMRTGLYQAWVQNRDGRQPLIVRITSKPFGERVRLWCPAGIAAEDLEAVKDILRAACWAADVQVTRDPEHTHMVTVDVIRHRREPGADHSSTPGDPSAQR